MPGACAVVTSDDCPSGAQCNLNLQQLECRWLCAIAETFCSHDKLCSEVTSYLGWPACWRIHARLVAGAKADSTLFRSQAAPVEVPASVCQLVSTASQWC